MLDRELGEFGRRMGLPGLAFNGNGLAALDVSRVGRLHFEKCSSAGEPELLLYLARESPPHDRGLPERALAECHHGRPRPYPLTAGMAGDRLILLTRLPERQATAAEMEKAALFLKERMDHLNPGA